MQKPYTKPLIINTLNTNKSFKNNNSLNNNTIKNSECSQTQKIRVTRVIENTLSGVTGVHDHEI